MSEICEPKRIISASIVSRRPDISRTALAKHVRRQIVVPDYESDVGVFFNPDRLPELRKAIAANRARNWRHVSAALRRPHRLLATLVYHANRQQKGACALDGE